MFPESLPDIPRLFTGLAEWSACFVYILILKRRFSGARFWVGSIVSLGFILGIQFTAGRLPLFLWIPGMGAAVAVMYLDVRIFCDIPARDAGYTVARAFVLAEFAASLGWQLYCYFWLPVNSQITQASLIFMIAIYMGVFVTMFVVERRHMEVGGRLNVRMKELLSEVGIAVATFAISNISFLSTQTPLSSRYLPELFYIRTLVAFCGLVILYAHQEQRREVQLKMELESIQNVLHRQYEQYQLSKENIDLLNRKYHDLKHQIAIIRAERDRDKQSDYLAELETSIRFFEYQFNTGNNVLDTVLISKGLICNENNITLNCVADGKLIDFISVMDICTIFGNALDNAIESVLQLDDSKKRLIHLALYAQNNFAIIRFENYFENKIRLEEGLPVTTKSDRSYHGFGLKSIRYAVENYGGSLTINSDNDWFILRILIPIPTDK